MTDEHWIYVLSVGTLALICICIFLMLNPSMTITVTAVSEARAVLRDCTAQPGSVATVKTIWAGDPPIPVEYEIICDKSGINE